LGQWSAVVETYIDDEENPGIAKRFSNDLRHFYEATDQAIWITFHQDKLWWAFAKGSVTADEANYKYRG
jgi:hypothetical protein